MKNRFQKLPECFWGVSQNEKTPMVFWFSDKTAKQPDKCKKVSSAEEACQLVCKAHENGIAMMAVAYIESDKQAEVISYSEAGKFEWLAYSTSDKSRLIRRSIERARKLALGMVDNIQVITSSNKTPELPVSQIIKDKDDPTRMVIRVRYNKNSDAKYLFRCNEAHIVGDFVAVEYCDGAVLRKKNVEVGWVGTMKESEILAEAKKLRRKDIATVVNETAIDDPIAWHEWGGNDPRKPAPIIPGVLTEEEVEEARAFLASMTEV